MKTNLSALVLILWLCAFGTCQQRGSDSSKLKVLKDLSSAAQKLVSGIAKLLRDSDTRCKYINCSNANADDDSRQTTETPHKPHVQLTVEVHHPVQPVVIHHQSVQQPPLQPLKQPLPQPLEQQLQQQHPPWSQHPLEQPLEQQLPQQLPPWSQHPLEQPLKQPWEQPLGPPWPQPQVIMPEAPLPPPEEPTMHVLPHYESHQMSNQGPIVMENEQGNGQLGEPVVLDDNYPRQDYGQHSF